MIIVFKFKIFAVVLKFNKVLRFVFKTLDAGSAMFEKFPKITLLTALFIRWLCSYSPMSPRVPTAIMKIAKLITVAVGPAEKVLTAS